MIPPIVRDDTTANDETLEQDIVNLALAYAMHERVSTIGRWVNQGHITIAHSEENKGTVILQIEDQLFTETRDVFPTMELVAQLGLAIKSGLSDQRQPGRRGPQVIRNYRPDDQISMDWHIGMGNHNSRAWAELAEIGYHNVAKLTATVTVKGLRP